MKFFKQTLFVLSIMAILFTGCSKDDDDNEIKLGDKNGILLVTFGSSYEAPQETFNTIDAAAKAKFPGVEIRWAYTAEIILNKLRQGNGEGKLNGQIIDNDNPEEALIQMVKDGYSKITIQSLHVIPGEEFDDVVKTVEKVKKQFPGLECAIGKPLLDSQEDLTEVAKILVDKFKTEITAGQPVCLMGHGTPEHENHNRYAQLEGELQKLAPMFFVGVVDKNTVLSEEENAPLIDGVLPKLEGLNLVDKKVTITPLMSIAGDHANNDMNGVTDSNVIEEQSWKERLENEEYAVTSVMKGLGDYPEITAIWMKHLEAARIK